MRSPGSLEGCRAPVCERVCNGCACSLGGCYCQNVRSSECPPSQRPRCGRCRPSLARAKRRWSHKAPARGRDRRPASRGPRFVGGSSTSTPTSAAPLPVPAVWSSLCRRCWWPTPATSASPRSSTRLPAADPGSAELDSPKLCPLRHPHWGQYPPVRLSRWPWPGPQFVGRWRVASADGMRFMIPVSTIHAFSRPAALTVGAAPLGKHFIRRYTKGEEALDIDALARLERVRLLHLDVDCTSLRADIRSPEGRVVAADRGRARARPLEAGRCATSRRPRLNLDPLARHRLWTPARGVRPSRPTLRQPISGDIGRRLRAG